MELPDYWLSRPGVEPGPDVRASFDRMWDRAIASGDSPRVKVEPALELFESALDTIKLGLSVLPEDEARQRIAAMVDACRKVALAAGGLESLLSVSGSISPRERATLFEIRTRLGGT